jgi:hypothetical protein
MINRITRDINENFWIECSSEIEEILKIKKT